MRIVLSLLDNIISNRCPQVSTSKLIILVSIRRLDKIGVLELRIVEEKAVHLLFEVLDLFDG